MTPTYRNFIYNEARGFIFAYVPKVACTNWKSLLRYMAGHEDWLDSKLAHDKVNGGLRYLDLDGPDAALLSNPEIRKYAMVRDPYSRTLSAYLNKVEHRLPLKPKAKGENHFDLVLREIDRFRWEDLGEDAYPEITFEVFLHWLKESICPFTEDEHWTTQSLLLRQPDVLFDIIGRFESLPEDSARILEAMGCSQRFPSQEDVRFLPTNAQSKLDRYLTPETAALIEEIFAEDFAIFKFPYLIEKKLNTPSPAQAGNRFASLIGTRPDVIEKISDNDWMWKGNQNKRAYLDAGWSVGRVLFSASLIAGRMPARVLDFGCGHGRVMRWMRALYPAAEIIASDRVRDAVDFCAQTFGAVPVYSDDSYEDIPLGGDFDMIWLGSIYTHLPMHLWSKLTRLLYRNLRQGGLLVFSYAGPHVADLIIGGERNAFADIAEDEMNTFLKSYRETGFGYSRHEGVGDREWGRSIISHERLFTFLKEEGLSISLLGERLYGSRQDIVGTQKL